MPGRLAFVAAVASATAALAGCAASTSSAPAQPARSGVVSANVSRANASGGSSRATSAAPSRAGGSTAGTLSLITEPDAGIGPLLHAISSARSSLDLVMYELEDTQAQAALAADEHRGVHVRVLLDGGYYGQGAPQNQAAYSDLRSHGVAVRWTPHAFALTHQKTFVVDGRTAYILTLNLTSQYYSTSRDFAVADRNPKDVSAIEATFNADWTTGPSPPAMAPATWCGPRARWAPC